MFYSQLKEQLSDPSRPQALVNFGSGLVAAVAASVLTQPADVVRTRMQLGLAVPGRGHALAALAAILQTQGPSGLLMGAWLPTTARVGAGRGMRVELGY
jgi:solute carrier family 25 protein 38